MIEVLINRESNQLAYLSKNAIRQFNTGNVMGVILGQCVFSKGGRAVGKLHHGVLRNEHGEQVARLTLQEPRSVHNNTVPDSTPVWELIKQIKDHGCLLIRENKDWSNYPLEELLK